MSFMLSGCGDQRYGSNMSMTPEPTEASVPPANIGAENFAKAWREEFDKMRGDIVEARERWKSNNINSYSFVARKDVGGVSSPWNRSPVLIKVEDGKPVSIEVVDKNDTSMLARTDGFEDFDTIDKLFDYMLSELENGRMVSAEYDGKVGSPEFVSIFRSFEIHGGRSIQISRFNRAD